MAAAVKTIDNFYSFRFCLFVIITLLIVTSSVLGRQHRFGYSHPAQRRWSKLYNQCSGKAQSPIAVSASKTIPLALPAIEMIGYHNLLNGPLEMHNNGHSVSLNIPKSTIREDLNGMSEFAPYIFGGKLEGEYEVEGLHFHWGDKNNRGAEHVINDIRYAMEMHIIHKNKKYSSMHEAMNNSDGLAVLAFFYQVRQPEALEISSIVRNLHLLEEVGEKINLNITFSLSSLLGNINLDQFYTYRGSLTTPPCSEAVTWILFPDPLSISLSQISKFRHLSTDGSILVDNYRKLQPIGNRRIFSRKVNLRNSPYDDHLRNDVHYSKWNWFY